MAEDPAATFADIVALAPRHGPVLRALRARLHALHPGVVEVARPGDRAVSWGWGPKKMSEAYAYALPYRDHVNLGFYHGALLHDPGLRLRGTGRLMRHVPIARLDDLADPALDELLAAAREERRVALSRP